MLQVYKIFLQEDLLAIDDVIEIDFSEIDIDLNRIIGKIVRANMVFNKGQKRYSIGVEFIHSNEK